MNYDFFACMGHFQKIPCPSKMFLLPICLLCACKGRERVFPFFSGQLHCAWFCLEGLKSCLDGGSVVHGFPLKCELMTRPTFSTKAGPFTFAVIASFIFLNQPYSVFLRSSLMLVCAFQHSLALVSISQHFQLSLKSISIKGSLMLTPDLRPF